MELKNGEVHHVCAVCGTLKEASEFPLCKIERDGVMVSCVKRVGIKEFKEKYSVCLDGKELLDKF